MKTVLAFLLVVASLVFSQGAPAATIISPDWQLYKVLATQTDTIIKGTAKDSLILMPTQSLPRGHEYVLSRGALKGTPGASITDSMQLRVRLDRYNAAGTRIAQSYEVDTIGVGSATNVNTGEQIALPVGKTAIGNLFRIMLKKGAGYSTLQADSCYIEDVELWRRKVNNN